MKRLISSLCVLGVLINLIGCKHEPPTYTVCLLDVSRSITPEGVQDEFKAMDDLVDRMHRGDRLTLIPINGNAASETPGRILHLDAPVQREPYDHDLTVFRKHAHEEIAAMRDAALTHPCNRTDILDSLDVAKQEFDGIQESRQTGTIRKLIVFSDFIEDDGDYRFASEPALASNVSARALAEQLRKENGLILEGVGIHVNALKSTDLRSLTPQRQKAIRIFWSDYLSVSRKTPRQ